MFPLSIDKISPDYLGRLAPKSDAILGAKQDTADAHGGSSQGDAQTNAATGTTDRPMGVPDVLEG
jgi:hypothetical protein